MSIKCFHLVQTSAEWFEQLHAGHPAEYRTAKYILTWDPNTLNCYFEDRGISEKFQIGLMEMFAYLPE